MRVIRKVWWHSSKGIVIKGSEYTNQSLKQKGRHIDNLLVTGCTRGCHSDNLRCNQWRKGCQYDDLLFSVVWQDLILHLKIKTRSHWNAFIVSVHFRVSRRCRNDFCVLTIWHVFVCEVCPCFKKQRHLSCKVSHMTGRVACVATLAKNRTDSNMQGCVQWTVNRWRVTQRMWKRRLGLCYYKNTRGQSEISKKPSH